MMLDHPFDRHALSARYDDLLHLIKTAHTERRSMEVFTEWEHLRRQVAAWKARAELQSRQDTSDPVAIANGRRAAEVAPFFEGRDAEIKAGFLASPHRAAMEDALGTFVFARWESDVAAFAPSIREDLEREALLASDYTQLLATARASLRGEEYSLTGLGPFAEHRDRALRREACETGWAIFDDLSTSLDDAFDALVRCRTSMARKLGYPNYAALAYKRLGRVGYGATQVALFRDEIRESVVPLAASFASRQAEAIGVESLMPWDEQLFDLLPQPGPPATVDELTQNLESVAMAIHPKIGALVRLMVRDNLMDLEVRPAKAGGAFCTFIPDVAMPFIFANYSGASVGAISAVHEMGHAFQNYESRGNPALEHILPTNEIGEIHSISLELLAWPFYDRLFPGRGAHYRAITLRKHLSILPYVAAIDHFQQLVYELPEASPKERCEIWLQMEARYTPWRNSGGIAALERGARWQRQRHVYAFPFYYIDYGLAICCALQLWQESLESAPSAIAKYLSLCSLGGTLSFHELLNRVAIRSPFDVGSLADVTAKARAAAG